MYTYKKPLRKRNITIDQKLGAKLESIVTVNVANSVGLITLRRPFVSAKNPHKCELEIMPRKLIALSTPLSTFVRCRSHCAMGNMKPMEDVSSNTTAITMPDMNMRK